VIALAEKVVEVRIDAPPELLEKLRSALEEEREYTRERDLLAYVLLLGLYLRENERRRKQMAGAGRGTQEIYEAMYRELASSQGAYASAHHAFAESARDGQTGRIVNEALRREVAATRDYLLPRLEREREQLLRRRDALLRALGED